MWGRAKDAVDPIGMLLDVLVELDREQPRLEGVRGVNAIFEGGVVRGSVANRVWPAHGHEPAAIGMSTMAHHHALSASYFTNS